MFNFFKYSNICNWILNICMYSFMWQAKTYRSHSKNIFLTKITRERLVKSHKSPLQSSLTHYICICIYFTIFFFFSFSPYKYIYLYIRTYICMSRMCVCARIVRIFCTCIHTYKYVYMCVICEYLFTQTCITERKESV